MGTQLTSGEVRLARIAALPHAPSLPSAAVAVTVDALSPCVPRIVSERLAAHHGAWLGEFRTLTVLFVQLLGIEAGPVGGLAREHRSAVIVMEGEPGIGKSELVELLRQSAGAARISFFKGTGEAIACSTPYHVWRGVFRSLFRLDTLPDDPAVHRRHVLEELAGSVEFSALAPLLNTVLSLQIPGAGQGRTEVNKVKIPTLTFVTMG